MPSRKYNGTAIATVTQVWLLRYTWLKTGLKASGTHARTQGLVKGKLVVPDDLPKHLKQSLFEHGGEYPVVARYSSEPGDPGLDVPIPPKTALASADSKDRIGYPSLEALP